MGEGHTCSRVQQLASIIWKHTEKGKQLVISSSYLWTMIIKNQIKWNLLGRLRYIKPIIRKSFGEINSTEMDN